MKDSGVSVWITIEEHLFPEAYHVVRIACRSKACDEFLYGASNTNDKDIITSSADGTGSESVSAPIAYVLRWRNGDGPGHT